VRNSLALLVGLVHRRFYVGIHTPLQAQKGCQI
jgi:hypothetical protein